MAVMMTVAGVVLLCAFAFLVWPPLVLLVAGSALTVAGLGVDWEAL